VLENLEIETLEECDTQFTVYTKDSEILKKMKIIYIDSI